MRSPAHLLSVLAAVLLCAVGVVVVGSLDGTGLSNEVVAAERGDGEAVPGSAEAAAETLKDSGWAVSIEVDFIAEFAPGVARVGLAGGAAFGLPESVPVWDGAGSPWAPLAAGPGLVRVEQSGVAHWRQVQVAGPNWDGEPRATLGLAGPGMVRVRVTDPEGQPVAQAKVWAGQGEPEQVFTGTDDDSPGGETLGITGADGIAEVPAALGGDGVPVVVWGPRHAAVQRVVTVAPDAITECAVILGPGVSMRVQPVGLLPASGTARGGARIWLAPEQPGDTRAQAAPWLFWNQLTEAVAATPTTIPGVPEGIRIQAALRHGSIGNPGRTVAVVAGREDLLVPVADGVTARAAAPGIKLPGLAAAASGIDRGLAYLDFGAGVASGVDAVGVPLAVWSGQRIWSPIDPAQGVALGMPRDADRAVLGVVGSDGRHLRRRFDRRDPWPLGWLPDRIHRGSCGPTARLQAALPEHVTSAGYRVQINGGPWRMVPASELLSLDVPTGRLVALDLRWHAPDDSVARHRIGPAALLKAEPTTIGPQF